MHAEHPRIPFGSSVESSLSHKAVRNRRVHLVGEFLQLLIRFRYHRSASDKDNRPRRFPDHGKRFFYIFLSDRICLTQDRLRRGIFILGPVSGYVLGNINQDGTRPSGLGNLKGPPDYARELLHILHNIIMLGNRHGNAGNINLLKAVLAEKGRTDIPRNGNQRDGIHVSGRDARNQISRSRAACRNTDSYLPG